MDPADIDAKLTGTVYAPNGEIPISGALVYTTTAPVEPIPDGAYCQDCVELPPEVHWTLTEPDGSFELPAASGLARNFVVQKGQFLRVTSVDIPPGDLIVEEASSTLPGEWNPDAGEWIPKMAVVFTQIDLIENLLAKVGLGEVDAQGTLVPGSESFDHLTGEQARALLDDLDAMLKYHIIFIPCGGENWAGPKPLSAARIENIQKYVAAGGKWYVTDWANEYVYEPFPAHQTFVDGDFGKDLEAYESPGTVLDPDMLTWLEALPEDLKDPGDGLPTLFDLPSVRLVDNWSAISETPDIIVQDDDGNDVNIGHYTWVEAAAGGPPTPNHMTVTANYSCGKMLFSTYHTAEGGHTGIAPQELILVYLILEIGVCQADLEPPE
ncbi:MAG: hypothetical protein V3V08_01530 [Nannocystaceae bacterium]